MDEASNKFRVRFASVQTALFICERETALNAAVPFLRANFRGRDDSESPESTTQDSTHDSAPNLLRSRLRATELMRGAWSSCEKTEKDAKLHVAPRNKRTKSPLP